MNRLKRLEKILKPRVKVATFNDTRRKGLDFLKRIRAGESIPEGSTDTERVKEVMEKLDKVRGLSSEPTEKD